MCAWVTKPFETQKKWKSKFDLKEEERKEDHLNIYSSSPSSTYGPVLFRKKENTFQVGKKFNGESPHLKRLEMWKRNGRTGLSLSLSHKKKHHSRENGFSLSLSLSPHNAQRCLFSHEQKRGEREEREAERTVVWDLHLMGPPRSFFLQLTAGGRKENMSRVVLVEKSNKKREKNLLSFTWRVKEWNKVEKLRVPECFWGFAFQMR